jgi:hypothetical protein
MSAAGDAVLNRLRADWLRERAKLSAALAYAGASKTSMPDGYWKAEHEAKRKLAAAVALAEEMQELP